MFSKILIANRGEIACRVMRTAHRMGIRTVAVYSDADVDALHVRTAHEAVRIGPAQSSESYLKGEAIIEAAKRSGAEAIHPGYGFLSENPDFVEAVTRAGLVFIGPSAAAIRAMGLKDAAKQLMEKAKVPVVPGYHGDAQEVVVLSGKANEIGFPVLIKARAGGGGKGMRRVDRQADFADALSSAKREARASFGDDRVLVEKYVGTPRHIEIQVFGDSHGDAVYLFERDCSLQRRHQKVIEEAPAPGMSEEMRAAMGEAAVTAAKAIGYAGAGTVEFIVDASEGLHPDRFWFMEMNTRLQVEHPVTELITGLDLVEWQIRVAAGEPLPKRQHELSIEGWAFEARLYAEDPAKNFLPATGTIAHLAFPERDVRIDSGVVSGDVITPFYDPMIAKLVTHGESREVALARMRAALLATEVAGTTTNLDFLTALCHHDGFSAGSVDTGLIDRDLEDLVEPFAASPLATALAAVLASGMMSEGHGSDPFDRLGPWSLWGTPTRAVTLSVGEDPAIFRVSRERHRGWRVVDPDGHATRLSINGMKDGRYLVEQDGYRTAARAVCHEKGITVFIEAGTFIIGVPRTVFDSDHDAGAGDGVSAPMPGIVKQVLHQAGGDVAKGDPLIIMEAMKMEMTLTAPRDGRIGEVLVADGEQVTDGDLLVRLEAEEVAA
ncbi:acetyl/propionyl/methylcrotonyl-CoA carboxylase subunit alpha [Pararhizobium haloflavum]|uniref:acetyl/propionyl/methylcrotonyl-CoA carboxylase subunit alpha n=1 Tax=Pararhizobium haloflavum TaxID=2037914 RepID=UPI000C1A139B|nr:acetyl/propionyl/methylcrotonyl-CoA carboxylase subunit alpha [Pararhizobium haloflavum]